jgi:hypothetical protein
MSSEVGIWLGPGIQGGELTFGGRDSARYTGDLTYYNVPLHSAYWSTPVYSVTVTTEKTEIKDKIPLIKRKINQIESRIGSGTGISKPNVIFDTSTNIILVPPRVAQNVHRLINDRWFAGYDHFSGLYTVPCDLPKTDLWFDLGPVAVNPDGPTLPPENVADSDNSDDDDSSSGSSSTTSTSTSTSTTSTSTDDFSAIFHNNNNNNKTGISWTPTNKFKVRGQDLVRERVPIIGGILNICFSGIQPSHNNEDDWVFGNIWFMNNYMTLDHRRRLIGVAPSVRN